MKLEGRIDERGLTRVYVSAETKPDDVAGRLAFVSAALSALEKVVLPLAIEVERAHVSRETGMLREPPPSPVVLRFNEMEIPSGVLIESTVEAPPAAKRASLAASGLRALLGSSIGVVSGAQITDWRRIEVIASLARARRGVEALSLSQAPKRGVASVVRSEARWFAGPIDLLGFHQPPIFVRFESDGSVVRLTLTVHWAPWTDAGTPERGFFDEAGAALARARFSPEA